MTAVAAPAVTTFDRSPFARSWRIVRLLTVNPMTTTGWPLIILGAVFSMTWTIWWIVSRRIEEGIAEGAEGIEYYGAVTFIFVYMLIMAVQAVNSTFPLALGMGATRRAFSFGSGLAFLLLAAAYSAILTIGAALEQATTGWGLHGVFFRTVYFATDAGPLAQWWVYFCWFAVAFSVGSIFAAVFVRWRAVGLTVALLLFGAGVVALIALATFTDSWSAVGSAIEDLGSLGVATVMLVPAALAAAFGYLLLRRATPRC